MYQRAKPVKSVRVCRCPLDQKSNYTLSVKRNSVHLYRVAPKEHCPKFERFSFDLCACDPGPVPYLHNQICLACFQLFFLHNNMVDHHIQGKHIFIAVWINKDRLKHFYSWLLYRCNLSNIATIHQF